MKRKTGTKEWSGSSCNIQLGCMHDCKYCYAKAMAVRYGRKNKKDWNVEEINISAVKKQYQLRGPAKQPVMFPTTHDITPFNIHDCCSVLLKMLSSGNEILIVSKPHIDCIATLCSTLKSYKNKILFRFTIGSVSDKVLEFWEPEAPNFNERMQSLKYAYNAGFKTSISCEPMLDGNINKVVELVRPYVTDTIWIGKMNKIQERLSQNGADYKTMIKGKELEKLQNDKEIIKLYNKFKNDTIIKWKDSIQEVVDRTYKLTEKDPSN